MENLEENESRNAELNFKQITKLFEIQELRRARYEFLEKIALLVISVLGFITALAWEEALKITFQEIFGKLNPFGQRFLYPIVITLIAVFISILASKLFLKKKNNK